MNVELITREDLKQFKNEMLTEMKHLLKPGQGQSKQWLKSYEVRKLLNISPGTLQNLRVNGTLRYTKIGGLLYYKYEDILKLLEGVQQWYVRHHWKNDRKILTFNPLFRIKLQRKPTVLSSTPPWCQSALFPALIKKLSPGGSLAVQLPDNFDEPAHRLMRSVAADGPWAGRLTGASKRIRRETADWYYAHLRSRVSTLDLWRTTYYHPLAGGAEAIVEWFKGTGLRPFLDPLSPEEKEAFLLRYTKEIGRAYRFIPMAACCCLFRGCSWWRRFPGDSSPFGIWFFRITIWLHCC
jgi:hypothetical protein